MSTFAFPDAPGCGFYPDDDQIIAYLNQRVSEYTHRYPNSVSDYFPDIDLCQFRPSDLPRLIEGSTYGGSKRDAWYFFNSRKESGMNRTVPNVGYWKITGQRQEVFSGITGTVIGTKKILSFQPSGRGSSSSEEYGWVVHEYYLLPSDLAHMHIQEMPLVACFLKKK